ncbi:hypothetical protein [Nocardia sp. R6R-6]|uniref:hypothetical protein n=1 Tax=Nocardia sp. R6R-6 TaxID=3459303 RepID=UPI00403D64C8
MNPLLLIGGAVLVTGLLVLVATMLLRPTPSRSHLSVAELQARLEQEQAAASPAPESSANEAASNHTTVSKDTAEPEDVTASEHATGEPLSATADDLDEAQARRRAAAAAMLRRLPPRN